MRDSCSVRTSSLLSIVQSLEFRGGPCGVLECRRRTPAWGQRTHVLDALGDDAALSLCWFEAGAGASQDVCSCTKHAALLSDACTDPPRPRVCSPSWLESKGPHEHVACETRRRECTTQPRRRIQDSAQRWEGHDSSMCSPVDSRPTAGPKPVSDPWRTSTA